MIAFENETEFISLGICVQAIFSSVSSSHAAPACIHQYQTTTRSMQCVHACVTAQDLPSGLKATAMTASVWPAMVLVHRVTALTRNTACGWYTISTSFSVFSSFTRSKVLFRVPRESTVTSLTENSYGISSSFRKNTMEIELRELKYLKDITIYGYWY